jgi:hypothetical protein
MGKEEQRRPHAHPRCSGDAATYICTAHVARLLCMPHVHEPTEEDTEKDTFPFHSPFTGSSQTLTPQPARAMPIQLLRRLPTAHGGVPPRGGPLRCKPMVVTAAGGTHSSNDVVRVCTHTTCRKQGARDVVGFFRQVVDPQAVDVQEGGCLGNCGSGPNVVFLPEGTQVFVLFLTFTVRWEPRAGSAWCVVGVQSKQPWWPQ